MFQLRRGFEVDVRVSFVDDLGNPASVEGAPLWLVGAGDFTLVHGDDPFAVVLQAVGAVGATAELSVEADADLGEGVVPVVASETVQVVSGQATTASFGFGEPRSIPVALEPNVAE